jgi:hypothetical protein
MTAVLSPATSRDWQVQAGEVEWSCWKTAAHVAHDLLAYASQLSARRTDAYLPLDLFVRPGAPAGQVLDVVRSAGGLLVLALEAAGPEARAWHWGMTDPSGFAALGINEVLVHTWDITQGLGLEWEPPEELAALVLARMFTQAPAGPAPRALLWCTGRVALPGHPRTRDWGKPTPPPTDLADRDW